LGGPSLSGTFGEHVHDFLKANYPATTGGRVDLAAYFLRRSYDLTRPHGDVGLITTNSIAEGDTLDAGLRTIVDRWGGSIVDAIPSEVWEGAANVSVALVHLHHGEWSGPRTLNGQQVETISAGLTLEESSASHPLAENDNLIFKGSNPLGTGFQLEPAAAARLLRTPENGHVVKPLYGADDMTKSSDLAVPGRWIIDFGGRTLEEAEAFTEPMEIVATKVKPERLAVNAKGEFKVKREGYRQRWWQLAERSARMYSVIESLTSVIAIPEVSKTMLPVIVPGGAVYLQTAFIVASDDFAMFGVLSSSMHWLWAAMPAHATSLESRPRYHQGRCFATFPRPPRTDKVRQMGEQLHRDRAVMLASRNEGLTKLYNRVTDPSSQDEDIVGLRSLHAELDHAVADAFGWDDLRLEHAVRQHRRFGDRWLPAEEDQREIERRLSDLNRSRAVGN
jgi:hypothetical protein